jgi:hypothetical protein
MTYRQYSDHIKLCAYLGKDIGGEYKEFYDFITELWRDMGISVYEDQGILFHKGDGLFMQQDFKNGWLLCHWDRVWSFLRTTKGMEYTETQDFIRGVVEEHLKCKALTPLLDDIFDKLEVEEHLKCKALTPVSVGMEYWYRVEEHLKSKVLTPVQD